MTGRDYDMWDLSDLTRVGPTKPMGYLPIETIRTRGSDPEVLLHDLKAAGLSAVLLPFGECHIGFEGALYAWHDETLKALLDSHREALDGWPSEPRAFVLRVAREMVSHTRQRELYELIGRAFDSSRFPFKGEE